MAKLKITGARDEIWDLLGAVWPDRQEEWMARRQTAPQGQRAVAFFQYPSEVGATVLISGRPGEGLRVDAEYLDDNTDKYVRESIEATDTYFVETDAIRAMVERVAQQAVNARKHWEEGEREPIDHTIKLTRKEFQMLKEGKCGRCGHLDALHNSHCCSFCTVAGCTCHE